MELKINISDKALEQCYYELCRDHVLSSGNPDARNLIGFARGDYVMGLTGVSYVKENREEILDKVRDALIDAFYPTDFPNAEEVMERIRAEQVVSNSRKKRRSFRFWRR